VTKDPRPVTGRFRAIRWVTEAVLVAVMFALPWTTVSGRQTILIDLPARKFYVLGLVIWPEELYFLWLLLALGAMTLFFFTALAGRLWCGYACPQTVFTDLFVEIGRFVQGKKARPAPGRRVLKHVIYAALGALIGFHVVAYFIPPRDLLARIPEGPFGTPVGAWLLVSAIAWANWTFVRQTFCVTVCPYARLQGVMLDNDSLIIAYDPARGEPRGKRGTTKGDCVDCGLCVAVCPTGIDIRDGLQMECIACAQCIDACDGVMARIHRPPGLIGYASQAARDARRPTRLLRPRVGVYAVALLALAITFVEGLAHRPLLSLRAIRNPTLMYQRMPDGSVANSYALHIENRDPKPQRFFVSAVGLRGVKLLIGVNPIRVDPGKLLETRVFVVSAPDGLAPGSYPVTFRVKRETDGRHADEPATFMMPPHEEEHSGGGGDAEHPAEHPVGQHG
jgi:cytochrome c oxidase accessory protein FixG